MRCKQHLKISCREQSYTSWYNRVHDLITLFLSYHNAVLYKLIRKLFGQKYLPEFSKNLNFNIHHLGFWISSMMVFLKQILNKCNSFRSANSCFCPVKHSLMNRQTPGLLLHQKQRKMVCQIVITSVGKGIVFQNFRVQTSGELTNN